MAGAAPTPRRPWWRRWFGTRAERAAVRFLKKAGLRVLVRNYASPAGEIDLVALDRDTLVFVEVRSTEQPDDLRPAASVDAAKQRQVTRAALAFLRRYRLLGRPARFDVVTVCWPAAARRPDVRHYPRAFEAVGRWQFWT